MTIQLTTAQTQEFTSTVIEWGAAEMEPIAEYVEEMHGFRPKLTDIAAFLSLAMAGEPITDGVQKTIAEYVLETDL